jgi:hypothetical protein
MNPVVIAQSSGIEPAGGRRIKPVPQRQTGCIAAA